MGRKAPKILQTYNQWLSQFVRWLDGLGKTQNVVITGQLIKTYLLEHLKTGMANSYTRIGAQIVAFLSSKLN